MTNMYLKTLCKDFVYEFSRPIDKRVSKDDIADFVIEVQLRVQEMFPSRGYNLYKESNEDMQSVVVVLDINDFEAVEI